MNRDNKYRRELTQLMHVIIPTVVLGVVVMGYDAYFKAVWDRDLHGIVDDENYATRVTGSCNFDVLRRWAGAWVGLDVVALVCTLVVIIVLWVVEPTRAATSKNKKLFTSITIGLMALALVCEIAAEIMRIFMFANYVGLDRDLSYCLYGDYVNDVTPVGTREAIKDVIRLEWWFYPFTTFVCGFVNFVLHAFAIGMAGKICRNAKNVL